MASTSANDAEELPDELEDQCTECHRSLAGAEKLLKPLLALNRSQVEDKLEVLDNASEILLLTYAMNSLFWVYLAVKGVNPKSHLIKQELERIQKVMKRARNVSNQVKTGGSGVQVDSQAAKRFIRSALWEGGDNKPDRNEAEAEAEGAATRKKRKLDTETSGEN